MIFDSITNRGEFFSNHYLDAVIAGDLGDLRRTWDEIESGDRPRFGPDGAPDRSTARSRLRGLAGAFFDARAAATEAGRTERAEALRRLNGLVLTALGFTPQRTQLKLVRTTIDVLHVPVATTVETGTGLLVVALDTGLAEDADDLFDDSDDPDSAGLLLDPAWREADQQPIANAPDAVSEIFATDEPPRYVLVCGGRVVVLAERAKWAEGRFLAVDLDTALERMDTRKAGEIETIAGLFSADALVPGHLTGDDNGGPSFLDSLSDASHKHAVGVSKDLRDGIRESVELLANEVIDRRLAANRAVYSGSDRVDPGELSRQCLRWLYRLLVLLYAESRPELGVLPVDDDAYLAGYSVDRLRELCDVDLNTDTARDGTHLDDSLTLLFDLVNDGYHAETAQQQLALHDSTGTGHAPSSAELYLQFPGLDAALFDPAATPLLSGVKLRNEVVQRVLQLLMLTPEGKQVKRVADARGFISYAQLGINQLGAVYEGLMAFSGFLADQDLYEVAKPKDGKADPSGGTWVLPVDRAGDYPDDVFVTRTEPLTGLEQRVRHRRGSFVYRLSGRDRQRSASYYTPEVLTRCVVKHALAELLGTDDFARVPGGSAGITEANQVLDLTVCEPALGSGAFLNEAINQLSAEYLRRRQTELGENLDPEQYRRELQKVKAHFALHQCYGVDLNRTAVELAEVSLWLNAMYPGLKGPWLGVQLRRGNSVIGCRRATWTTSQLTDRPWAHTKTGSIIPPVLRPLAGGLLADDEIHHFLLPGHGWAAGASGKEAADLRPDKTKVLRDWQTSIQKAPTPKDSARLLRLAAAVEEHWWRSIERVRLVQKALRRDLGLYGAEVIGEAPRLSRMEAERILGDPDSSLGRLRVLMDAWIGLWSWPLETSVDPPTWEEWLATAEGILAIGAQAVQGEKQLTLDDLIAEASRNDLSPVSEQLADHPWLGVAVSQAHRQGAWHWELEFGPVFSTGGFDLQVGNPPWVRLDWDPAALLADLRPAILLTDGTAECQDADEILLILDSLSDHLGYAGLLGSPVRPTQVPNGGTNLYRAFLGVVWSNGAKRGVQALLHPDAHLFDKKSFALRRLAYGRHLRLFQFTNQLSLFEEVGHTRPYSIGVYGSSSPTVCFLRSARLLHPNTLDNSMQHDGIGPVPGIKVPSGEGWDLTPHRSRLHTVDAEFLELSHSLFPSLNSSDSARLPDFVTNTEVDAVTALSKAPRLAAGSYQLDAGLSEQAALKGGWILRSETSATVRDQVLQNPHFSVSNPMAQETMIPYKNHQSYVARDVEGCLELTRSVLYIRAKETLEFLSGEQQRFLAKFRLFYKRWTDPEGERTLVAALMPPGLLHVESTYSLVSKGGSSETSLLTALWSSIPADYIVRLLGNDTIRSDVLETLPSPEKEDLLAPAQLLRVLRLNCLTPDYEGLWEELSTDLLDVWKHDYWTDEEVGAPWRAALGDVAVKWTTTTPLRRDYERRLALVELDALTALMLGLNAEQLCAMYRTQFPVLRKYEYSMVFDSEGRKISKYHQSAGYRQAQLQAAAKEKGSRVRPEYERLWDLVMAWERDPSALPDDIWGAHFVPPFHHPDREKEMTRAFEAFAARRAAGEYPEPK